MFYLCRSTKSIVVRNKFCLLIGRWVQVNKVEIKKVTCFLILNCILEEIIFLFFLFDWTYVRKVQILWEGHTIWKNNTRVHAIFFESLSINVKTKWETDFFSNFCGLLRIFQLYVLLHFLVCSCMPLKSGVRQKGSRQMLHVHSIVVKNCFSNHWGERSQCIKRWIS